MTPWGKWDGASVYWAVWFFVAFFGPEIYWIITNKANTLSYQVWRLEQSLSPESWNFARYITAAFCVWLFFHFVFGIFR